ncbi:MAG: SLC13 family permease [Pseudomonadota bacterium]
MPDEVKKTTKLLIKQRLASAAIFILCGVFLIYNEPTIEIAWVTAILLLTIYLFAFEVVDVDVAAISIMVILGLTDLFAPLMGLKHGLVDTNHLFDGFSSNAVISIIAVMIIGAGLDKTGIMSKVSTFILKVGGKSESRIIPIISSTVGIISSFMQNVGAAALFLPVVSRISARANVPMSRLLMPMGFCAILGGTVTMVGSSPLILLNDLIITSNSALEAKNQMDTFGLFSVTPIGLALVLTGILYFIVAGKYVLPSTKSESETSASSTMNYFQKIYGIQTGLFEVVVKDDSSLIGHLLGELETKYKVRAIGVKRSGHASMVGEGAMAYDTEVEAGMVLGIVAPNEVLKDFVATHGLKQRSEMRSFSESLSPAKAGIAEIVIPPGSDLIGKSAREFWLRKTTGFSLIALHRDGETLRQGENIRSMPFQSGDTLVGHIPWENLARLEKDPNYVVVTTEFPHEELRPQKVGLAALFFGIAIFLVLFTDIRLSIALLTGAIGMILSGVLKIDEAYQAVSWKTVFLLASLIPLGMAVESSGTAKWIADQTIFFVGDMPIWVIQLAVAILATFFTLVMSNVGATVLLVPLAVNIAIGVGADPAVFALTVAIATSNSFLIPTHQVNALIMGPAGYRVVDFIRAGGVMTILFLVVMMLMMNLIY